MTDILFLSLAKRAKQVFLWLVLALAGIGVVGVWHFFSMLPMGLEEAMEYASVKQGIHLLYFSAFLFFFGSMYHLWTSRRYKRNMSLSEDDKIEPSPHNFIRLPSGVDLNLHADPIEVLKVLKAEDYSKNKNFWIDLRQTYCRAPFKGKGSHNKIRTFLLGKTR